MLHLFIREKFRNFLNSPGIVSIVANGNVLEKHRYYFKHAVQVITFLDMYELAFYGDYADEEYTERDLFAKLSTIWKKN